MPQRILIIGATGLLGQALTRRAGERGWDVNGAARRGANHVLDVLDDAAVDRLIDNVRPDVVVNCAALVDLALCERDPEAALRLNGRAPGVIAAASARLGAYFVQISTDHFYSGDGRAQHSENAPVVLLNAYARSKFAGEESARKADPRCLIIRTNIVGFRGWAHQPTFAEWACNAIHSRAPMTLYDDYFTSSIEVGQFADAFFDILATRPDGVLNLASQEVASKKEFVVALAGALGVGLGDVATASVKSLHGAPRAESLGLDVASAEALLGRPLPDLGEVIEALRRANLARMCT
jgi:dTDP-4-dehydrorhamnose reductase